MSIRRLLDLWQSECHDSEWAAHQPSGAIIKNLSGFQIPRFPHSRDKQQRKTEAKNEENVYDLVIGMELESGTGAKWRERAQSGTRMDKGYRKES